MSDKYIYSTLAADNEYVVYAQGGSDMPRVESRVLVKGGAGIADKRIVTPRGVVSGPFTEEQIASLEGNVVFKRHVENGFIHIDDKLVDAEKVAADMEGRDPGGPLVDQDFTEDDKAKPISGKPKR